MVGEREGSSAQKTLQQQHPISLGSHQIWGPVTLKFLLQPGNTWHHQFK